MTTSTSHPHCRIEDKLWLRVSEAVQITSISRSKLYELIKEGKIRSSCLRESYQVRGTRLIDRASLLAYIESCVSAAAWEREGGAE
ncbi:MAG: hypothetical protein CMO55_05345 [Verrucomicrobiales bacterium]|nr:hypothetical protein [Verrucomicrobiales bacterium]